MHLEICTSIPNDFYLFLFTKPQSVNPQNKENLFSADGASRLVFEKKWRVRLFFESLGELDLGKKRKNFRINNSLILFLALRSVRILCFRDFILFENPPNS